MKKQAVTKTIQVAACFNLTKSLLANLEYTPCCFSAEEKPLAIICLGSLPVDEARYTVIFTLKPSSHVILPYMNPCYVSFDADKKQQKAYNASEEQSNASAGISITLILPRCVVIILRSRKAASPRVNCTRLKPSISASSFCVMAITSACG